jgi:hypothetical protein
LKRLDTGFRRYDDLPNFKRNSSSQWLQSAPKITPDSAASQSKNWLPAPCQAETFAQLHETGNYVLPAKAGIQYYQALPGFRPSPE